MEKCGSATQLAYEQPCRGLCGWHSVREGEVSKVMGTRTPRIKKGVVHLYTMEYYLAITKEEMLPFVTAWMNLESFALSE